MLWNTKISSWVFLKSERSVIFHIWILTSTFYYISIESIVTLKFLINKQDIFEECHDLILELMDTACYKLCQSLKRKHHSVPGSPSGVIDAYFSSESSNESWSVASSISSSPEPQYKRNKTQDQRMTLAPLGSNLHWSISCSLDYLVFRQWFTLFFGMFS